jgi:Nitroreductase
MTDRQDPARRHLRANGGNTQKWRFLVIKDRRSRRRCRSGTRRPSTSDRPALPHQRAAPGVTKERYLRQHAAVEYLTDHFHEAPVWIVACLEDGPSPNRAAGSSIYPAVQNMGLAARALGLGTTLTTRHLLFEKEADGPLGLPAGVHSYAILPDRLPDGQVRPGRPRPAQRDRLPGSLGRALSRRLAQEASELLQRERRSLPHEAWPAMGTSTIPLLPGMFAFIHLAASLNGWPSLNRA